MSIESQNIFINELKFDVFKDKVKGFLIKNIKTIVAVFLFISVVFLFNIFIKLYQNNKIEDYNNKIYFAINSNNKVNELEEIYNDKSTPRISKTFSGLKLIEEHINNVDSYSKIIDIYVDILENEKDVFFKNYAGLNLLLLKINEEILDEKYINELFSKLDNANNPLQDMILEQKAVFLIKQDKKNEAKTILNNLLRKNLDNKDFIERLNGYFDMLK